MTAPITCQKCKRVKGQPEDDWLKFNFSGGDPAKDVYFCRPCQEEIMRDHNKQVRQCSQKVMA